MKFFTNSLTVALVFLAGSASGLFDAFSSGELDSPQIDEVLVDNGRFTVHIENVPMDEALRKIADGAGLTMSIEGVLEDPVSLSFSDKSLNEGFRQILGDTPVGIWKGTDNRIHIYVLDLYKGIDDGAVTGNAEPDNSAPLSEAVLDSTITDQLPLISVGNRVKDIQNDNDLADLIAYDPDPVVRRLAVIKLGQRRSDSSLQALALGLGDINRTVRLRSVVSIGKIGNETAIELLSETLLYDPNPVIRRMAATQLKKSRHHGAVAALQTAQGDLDEKVRIIAETALARLDTN